MRRSTFLGDKKKGFSSVKRGEAIRWRRGLVSLRISTGKAIQWRGPGHSMNRRTLKTEKLLASSQKIPICQACGTPSTRETPEQKRAVGTPLESSAARHPSEPEEAGLLDAGSQDIELRDPYLNPLEEIVLETGSIPCTKHGYDHLSRDSTCEFYKRALGPLYRHLSKKYGRSLGDETPTLSFDFSSPHPVAVTGARFMFLFMWRLETVCLLWAFAVTGKAKECVRSCLNDVVAELNTYTGGSKPPVLRIHSDQAREFLSQPVMEWLMHHNIKQTFTSTGDPSANGVAERWIDLVKVKATVLLASRYLPMTLWCYAVPWVAYTYNQKTLGQTPKKAIPEFGQLLLLRTKHENKFQDRAEYDGIIPCKNLRFAASIFRHFGHFSLFGAVGHPLLRFPPLTKTPPLEIPWGFLQRSKFRGGSEGANLGVSPVFCRNLSFGPGLSL